MRKIPAADKDPATRSIEATVMYLRQLVEAKDELLVCYRVGKRPTEKLMRKLDALQGIEGLLDAEPAIAGEEVRRLLDGIEIALESDDMTESLQKLLSGWDLSKSH